MVVMGEIDCRESLLVCVDKGIYASLAEAMQVTIVNFIDSLRFLCKIKRFKKVGGYHNI